MNAAVRDRLRNGGADRLADLMLDDLLDRPVSELVDSRWLAERVVSAVRSAAADPRVESWLRARVADLRARVPAGPIDLPPAMRAPLGDLLARPYVPDRALIGELVDHDTARLLLKNLFQDLLVAFARRLRPMGGKGGLPSFGRLQKLGEGLLGAVGHELEAQLENKAREFTDQAVQKLVAKMADHLCNPALVSEYGAWRAYAFDVLCRTDARVLAGEVEKLDPESLIATGAALVRAVAARSELTDEVTRAFDAAMDEAGDRSARALLGGVEEHALDLARDLLRQRARALIETDAFTRWWDEVVDGTPPGAAS